MDANEGRLQDLQMADLGTARREYISTADYKRGGNTRIEVLEASRLSNIPGSEAHRAAEINKPTLVQWNSIHEKIGDTENLENLDNLLNGQSHRIRLNAVIRESGGQEYSKSIQKSDNFLRVAERIPSLQGPPTRYSVAMGNSGKQFNKPALGSHKSAIPQSVSIPKTRTSRPLPVKPGPYSALDTNSKKNNNLKSSKNEDKGKISKRKPSSAAPARNRQPMGDFARILSPPESFLAVARSLAYTRFAKAAPLLTKKVSDNGSPAVGRKSLEIAYSGPVSKKEGNNQTVWQSQESPSDVVRDQRKQTPVTGRADAPINQGEVRAAISQKLSPPEPTQTCEPEDYDQSSGPMSLDSSEGEASSSPVDTQAPGPENIQPNVPVSNLDQKPEALKAPTMDEKKEDSKHVSEDTEVILVDLCPTPPPRSVNGQKNSALIVSPSCEELKGLDFTRIMDHNTSVAEYQRDIDLLCQLMESTTLSDRYLTKLQECKEELELRKRMVGVPCAQPRKGREHLEAARSTAQETTAMISIKISTLGGPFSDDKALSRVRVDSLSPQTRLSARAPQFIPKACGGYHTPSGSVSSDSMTLDTPSKQKLRPHLEESHIFGDHLLPGSKARSVSISQETHIIGNHLIPGRANKEFVVSKDELPTKLSRSKEPNIPTMPRVKFSIPSRSTSKSIEIKPPKSEWTSASRHTSRMPSAERSTEAMPVLATQTMNKQMPHMTTMNAVQKSAPKTDPMQESIYAPWPTVVQNQHPSLNRPTSSSMMSSKYAF